MGPRWDSSANISRAILLPGGSCVGLFYGFVSGLSVGGCSQCSNMVMFVYLVAVYADGSCDRCSTAGRLERFDARCRQ